MQGSLPTYPEVLSTGVPLGVDSPSIHPASFLEKIGTRLKHMRTTLLQTLAAARSVRRSWKRFQWEWSLGHTRAQAAEHCGCSEDDLCPIAGIDESAKVRSIFDGSQGGANSTLASKHLKALTSAGALRPEPLGHGAALLRICYSVFPQMDWGFVFSDDFAWLLRKSNSKLMATAICPHLPASVILGYPS